MNFRVFLRILIIAAIFMSSCGKLIDEFYLTDEMREQIPFNGFESIVFQDSDENIFVLQGGDRFSRINKVNECINCKDYHYFEMETILFNDNTYEINFYSEASRKSQFSIRYKINNYTFRCSFNSPLSQNTLEENQIYIDSLSVNSQTYYNIFSDALSHTGSIPVDPYPERVYYSTDYGVVKIDYSDGSAWELLEVEWNE